MTMETFVSKLTGPTRAKLTAMDTKRKRLIFSGLRTGEVAEVHDVAQADGLSDWVSGFMEVTVSFK